MQHEPDTVSGLQKKEQSLVKLKTQLCVTAFFVFFLVPLVSILFATADAESPLYTSVSRLGWVTGHKGFMYFWGGLTMSVMCYGMWMAMESSHFSKPTKEALRWLMISFCTIVFIGACVPAHDGLSAERSATAKAHDTLSMIGLFGIAGVLIAYCAALFLAKDIFRGAVASLAMGFILMSGIFSFIVVKDPTTYCGVSAVTQMYAFNAMDIFIFCIYLRNVIPKLLPKPQE